MGESGTGRPIPGQPLVDAKVNAKIVELVCGVWSNLK